MRVIVTARLVRPGWDLLCTTYTATWVARLPPDDPLAQQAALLKDTLVALTWARPEMRAAALNAGLRLLLAHGYVSVHQITEQDLLAIPAAAELGSDTLDAALCVLGIFARTPKRAASRHARTPRRSPAELVAVAAIPEHFRAITALYLETYAARISQVYATLQHKVY